MRLTIAAVVVVRKKACFETSNVLNRRDEFIMRTPLLPKLRFDSDLKINLGMKNLV